MIIAATELSIATCFHASRGILLPEGGGNVKDCGFGFFTILNYNTIIYLGMMQVVL
jgi:hypothetical protein